MSWDRFTPDFPNQGIWVSDGPYSPIHRHNGKPIITCFYCGATPVFEKGEKLYAEWADHGDIVESRLDDLGWDGVFCSNPLCAEVRAYATPYFDGNKWIYKKASGYGVKLGRPNGPTLDKIPQHMKGIFWIARYAEFVAKVEKVRRQRQERRQ